MRSARVGGGERGHGFVTVGEFGKGDWVRDSSKVAKVAPYLAGWRVIRPERGREGGELGEVVSVITVLAAVLESGSLYPWKLVWVDSVWVNLVPMAKSNLNAVVVGLPLAVLAVTMGSVKRNLCRSLEEV